MEELGTLRVKAGPQEYAAGQALYREGGVRFLAEEESALLYAVGKGAPLSVRLLDGASPSALCPCGAEGLCRHAVAAFLEAYSLGRMTLLRRRRSQESTARLRAALGSALPVSAVPVLEVTLHLPADEAEDCSVSLRAGCDRLYAVGNAARFLFALERGEPVDFGKRPALDPVRRPFSARDRALLSLLTDAAETLRLSGLLPRSGAAARQLRVPGRFLPRLLRLLSDRPFLLRTPEGVYRLRGIPEGRVDLLFAVSLHGREVEVRAERPEGLRVLSPESSVVFCDGELLRAAPEQRPFLHAMDAASCLFCFPPEQAMWAVSELLPRLQQAGHTVVEGRLKDRLIHRPLRAEARLDREGAAISCRLAFRYGDASADPFRPESALPDGLFLVRDGAGEGAVLLTLSEYGFAAADGRALLRGSQRIWRFFQEGIPRLQERCDVFLSDAFQRLRPRRPQLSARVTARGSGLVLQLLLDGAPAEDADAILAALRERRQWHRLENGAFLDLSQLTDWQALAEAAVPEKRTEPPERGAVEIKSHRAFFLMHLLSETALPVETDAAAGRRFAPRTEPCPEPLGSALRPYQTRGFAWLQTLHRLHLGGVLADDMGLGKTVQMIALLLWAAESAPDRKPSVLVAPTSLLYNWAAEAARFAPSLRVLVAEGAQIARARQIESLASPDAPDLYLTSYPLVRRDIDLLSAISFRFAVLDEAQYIKNAASVGAGAVRRLKAETRFAMTGTPMENHPGELWSLFDFALPGYLGAFSSFMRRYGEGQDSEDLRRRLRPFLLRRLKGDVLSELPAKTESVMSAEMTPEQARVYRAALARLRPQDGDYRGAGRFRVLAALTELRETCDHPALILPEYAGSSGKLEMLTDILPGALASGHRVLIFSQFTRMLRILEQRLFASGVECFYLDGETPARERVSMADRFNRGEGAVFLISLKAGGAGLNLTGADWVIHYDPWWNPAAEEQATDRAHRIGQNRPVTVTRLITRGTVEEQVLKLASRKRDLFDRVVAAGETFPTQLTEAEIRALFEG